MAFFSKHSDKEYDALAKKLKAEESQSKKNEEEIKALKSDLDARNAEIKKLKDDLSSGQSMESDLKSENDLLLAQLHQVQEELEKYYLNNKDLESALNVGALEFKRARYALVNHLLGPSSRVKSKAASPARGKKPSKRKSRN